MFSQDEFRLRIFKILREDGKGHHILDLVSNRSERDMLSLMKTMGWIGHSKSRRMVWITMKGRQVCRQLERIYS